MAEPAKKETFSDKYKSGEKIWSGGSFINYMQSLRTLLAELPISAAAVPGDAYEHRFAGNLDYVFGELMYTLTGTEGYFRDTYCALKECFIKPIFIPHATILEFGMDYKTKAGEEGTRTAEVIRTGDTSYLFFTDYHRPL